MQASIANSCSFVFRLNDDLAAAQFLFALMRRQPLIIYLRMQMDCTEAPYRVHGGVHVADVLVL